MQLPNACKPEGGDGQAFDIFLCIIGGEFDIMMNTML